MTAASLVRRPPGLLVSVRNSAEAEAALEGGADLIDVKEPARGPLGRSDDATVAAVVSTVAGRAPVSAALGELHEWQNDTGYPQPLPGTALVKLGLARLGEQRDWRDQLLAFRRFALQPSCAATLAFVAYADWQRAGAPPPLQVADCAVEHGCGLLIDTWGKDGSTLLDWIDVNEAALLCRRLREAQLPVALAGALGRRQIQQLRQAAPDWFAVRGSVCVGGRRDGAIQTDRVRRIKTELSETIAMHI